MSNKNKYFIHDCNARNDDKLTALRIEHGPAGYGVFFMILERLREEDDYRGQLTDRYIKALAYDFHAEAALVRSVINDFGLFQIDEETGTFGSARFDGQMKFMENLSQARQSAAAKRWSGSNANASENDANAQKNDANTNANASENDANAQKNDANTNANASENDANASQETPENAKTAKLTTKDTDGQQRTKNANASENECKCIEKSMQMHRSEFPPLIPPSKTKQNKTDNDGLIDDGLIEGRNEGRTDEEFEMPDETAEANALRARLRDVDWPECDIDEFMRLADYGQDAEARPLQLLARFEVDRVKYESTRYTPINIMRWLRSEEKRGELQPRLTSKALLVLRDLRRRDIAGSVKNQIRAWLEGAPDRQQRTDRAEKMSAALKDIDSGRINRPDAFLIATMKKAYQTNKTGRQ